MLPKRGRRLPRRPYLPAVLLAAALTLLGWSHAQSSGHAAIVNSNEPAMIGGLFSASNAARAAEGVGPLAYDAGLAAAAHAHAHEMARLRFFDHVSPTAANATLDKRVANALSPLVEIGENLARLAGLPDGEVPRTVVDGWLASPGHRRNLLDEDFNRVGFGVVRDPVMGVVIVQVLGWEPTTLSQASYQRVTEVTTRMALRFDSTRPLEVVLSFGGGPGAPIRLPQGISDVILEPLSADAELQVGVRDSAGRYLVDEAATLHGAAILQSATAREPARTRGTFTPTGGVARRLTRLVAAFSYTEAVAGMRLTLDYPPLPGEELMLFVGEDAWPDAQIAPGHFELLLADLGPAAAAQSVYVGVVEGGGRIRIFHQYSLTVLALRFGG